MTAGYFAPLSDIAFGVGESFDYDGFKLWTERQQLNFSHSISVGGDIISANWDGASPLDLSTEDTVATTGFALDSSAGAAQFMGDIHLAGDLNLTSLGSVTSPNWGATQGSDAEFAASRLKNAFVGVRSGVNITNAREGVFLGAGSDADGDSGGVPANMYSYTGIAFGHTGASSPFPSSREFYSLGSDTPTDPLQADNYTGSPAAIFYSEHRDRLYIASPRTTIENDLTVEGDVLVNNGSAANPSYHFASDFDTGMYRVAANIIGFSAGGGEGLRVYDHGIRAHNGTVSEPSIAFLGDADTGFYQPQSAQVGLSLAGSLEFLFTSSYVLVPAIRINNSSTIVQEGAGNAVRLATGNGYVDIGPQNSGFAHIYTDAPRFAFNKSLTAINVGYQHYSLPTYNNVNGSMRWMGTNVDMGQAHTSSSKEHKRYMAPIRTRGITKDETTGSIFDRLQTTFFHYADDHPNRDRWLGEDADGNEVDHWEGFENPPIGRMGFIFEQVKEVAPHWAYDADGMDAVSYEGMLPDFMAWATATIRDLRTRIKALEAVK